MFDSACAYTGQRPGMFSFRGDEAYPVCKHFKRLIRQELSRLAREGVTIFLGGLSIGPDMWTAEAVLSLKQENPDLRLVAALTRETEVKYWPEEYRERHDGLMDRCDARYLIDESGFGGGGRRDRWLVDSAGRLLLIQGRKPSVPGLSRMVRYAVEQGREITVLRADIMRAAPFSPSAE